MTPSATRRSPTVRSLDAALVALAIAVVLISILQFAAYPSSGIGPAWVLDLFTVTRLVYAAAGLLAWWRRPSNGLGMIIVGGGTGLVATATAAGATVS